jgi:hypothetical protein
VGKVHIGPKNLLETLKQQDFVINDVTSLRNRISDLEYELSEQKIKKIIEYVPQEVIKEVKIIEEKIIEKPVEVIKYVEKEVRVIEEKILEVIKEVPKEIKIIEERTIEKPVEIIKHIDKIIHKIPNWVIGMISIETIAIILLLIKH